MLPIDRATKRLDRVYAKLPEALRPEAANAIKTVALVTWTRRQVGRFGDGRPAIVQQGHLLLVDHASGAAIAQRGFDGAWPPQVVKSTESTVGRKPYGAIVRWLEQCQASAPAR